MGAPNLRDTQLGLGTDEGDEADLVDAWWNPPPAAPVSCPPSGMFAAQSSTIRRRSPTLSLEEDE
jgi:hypothetical protein